MAEEDNEPKGGAGGAGKDKPEEAKGSSADKTEDTPPAVSTVKVAEGRKAAWAAPLARLDRGWTRLDARLCAGVLVAEILTLVFWIAMKSLASTGRGGPGLVFRSLVTAVVFGAVAHLITRRMDTGDPRRLKAQGINTAAVVVGGVLGGMMGDAGTNYFGNLLAWMQNASILVFFGGASGVAKRLTLWLALLGASVATGQGKHINVDVVMRFLSPRARVPVAVLGWLAAALVCLGAAWGFFDHVAVADYRIAPTMPCPHDTTKRCTTTPSEKIDRVWSTTKRDLFLAGRQVSLDLKTFPKVISGTPYNESLTPKEWNAWLREGNWDKEFDPDAIKAMELPEDGSGGDYRTPAVTSYPGGSEQILTLLIRELNFVVAFGLLVIAIRFVLRSLLAIGGWIDVDPNAVHGDDELVHAHEEAAQ